MSEREKAAFRRAFGRIRREGELVSGKGKLGGMWHADVWRLGDATAWLTDDGATRMLKADGLEIREKYDGTLVYAAGDGDALLALDAQVLDDAGHPSEEKSPTA